MKTWDELLASLPTDQDRRRARERAKQRRYLQLIQKGIRPSWIERALRVEFPDEEYYLVDKATSEETTIVTPST